MRHRESDAWRSFTLVVEGPRLLRLEKRSLPSLAFFNSCSRVVSTCGCVYVRSCLILVRVEVLRRFFFCFVSVYCGASFLPFLFCVDLFFVGSLQQTPR